MNTISKQQFDKQIQDRDGAIKDKQIINVNAVLANINSVNSEQYLKNLVVSKNWSKDELIKDFESTASDKH